MADKRYTFRGKAVPLFRIGGTPVAEYSPVYVSSGQLEEMYAGRGKKLSENILIHLEQSVSK